MRRMTALVLMLFVASCGADLGCSRVRQRIKERKERLAQTPPVVQPTEPTSEQPTPAKPVKPAPTPEKPTKPVEPKPAAVDPIKPVEPAKPADATNLADIVPNPTTQAGRGVPDLEDATRPAAWLYLDGYEGQFIEKDGRAQIQWVIEAPVVPAPTLRLQVYEPLLGKPTTVRFFLQDVPDEESGEPAAKPVRYAFASEDGTFQVGREYELCNLGEGFVIRQDPRTADEMVVDRIPPLPPGPYLIAAAIESDITEQKGLAITYFTVGVED